jgi:hypothetical protein
VEGFIYNEKPTKRIVNFLVCVEFLAEKMLIKSMKKHGLIDQGKRNLS